MVGYYLGNTLTEHGHVARGICAEDANNYLTSVVERNHIEKEDDHARFTEDNGVHWERLPSDTVVSMNLWGLRQGFMQEAWNRFACSLSKILEENPLKGEYYLPSVISILVQEGLARVKVLRSSNKWYGVTYAEDKPLVTAAISQMTAERLYPDALWERE